MLGEIIMTELVWKVKRKGIMTMPVPEGVDIQKAVEIVRRFGLGCSHFGGLLLIIS